jgi:3'-phosphoadenosine 5'-phosphosulfate sulfotransferase (PAPS reductase)/FAD synthetase
VGKLHWKIPSENRIQKSWSISETGIENGIKKEWKRHWNSRLEYEIVQKKLQKTVSENSIGKQHWKSEI